MMRLLKWTVFFIVSFFISWVVISTFSQIAFTMKAPARIIFYKTPEIPIYRFIFGAFLLGLIIGLIIAAYNFVYLKTRGMKQSRELHALQDEVSKLKAQIGQAQTSLDEDVAAYEGDAEPGNSTEEP